MWSARNCETLEHRPVNPLTAHPLWNNVTVITGKIWQQCYLTNCKKLREAGDEYNYKCWFCDGFALFLGQSQSKIFASRYQIRTEDFTVSWLLFVYSAKVECSYLNTKYAPGVLHLHIQKSDNNVTWPVNWGSAEAN